MKLIDLHEGESQFFKTEKEINDWLYFNGIIANYKINKDLTVDVIGDVDLSDMDFEYFPVRFGTIIGDFDIIRCYKLKSLEGCPTEVSGSFRPKNCTSLTSLQGAPAHVGRFFNMTGCTRITTLHDIHKIVKHVGVGFYHETPELKSNVLGLLKVDKLQQVRLDSGNLDGIINKYLPHGNILDCIDELTDNGFEEFAKL